MREYKVYYSGNLNIDTVNFNKFIRELSDNINTKEEIMERVKKCNIDFSESVKEILKNEENAIFCGAMIARKMEQMPRLMYIKDIEYNGVKYDVEIDELERKFSLLEIA